MTDTVKSLNFNLLKQSMRFNFKHILIINKYINFHWYGKISCNAPDRKKTDKFFFTFYVERKKLAGKVASAAQKSLQGFPICMDCPIINHIVIVFVAIITVH